MDTPSVPNPCSVCGAPIFGSFMGTGDGTMKNGGSFAHPECYWRNLAENIAIERDAYKRDAERYRWLRDARPYGVQYGSLVETWIWHRPTSSGKGIDAAIDEAMKKSKP